MKPQSAKYIWADASGQGRNRYVLFRRAFELDAEPAGGQLHVFADTRYRLLLNGEVVGHGPARFHVSRPEYDTYELGGRLRSGTNVVAVVVNSYGTHTFHSERSIGGLVAWGSARTEAGAHISLSTGEGWKALESPGHLRKTAKLSFALNPGEVLDARGFPFGWALPEFDAVDWPDAVPLADQEHWGELRQRSIPLLDESKRRPVECLGAWSAELPEEDLYSFVLTAPPKPHRARNTAGLAMTCLHSPRRQRVTLGAFWGEFWLNGRRIGGRRGELELRRNYTVTLRRGWNRLVAMENTYYGTWVFYLGVPRGAGVTVSAEPRLDSPDIFLLAGPWRESTRELIAGMDLPLDSADELPAEYGPWERWPRDRSAQAPYTERCWTRFTALEGTPDGLPVRGADYADETEGGGLSLLYDFGTEVLGRPVLDFTAAAGTVVDLTYSERLRGGLPADHGAHHIRMAERRVAREGRQRWHLFHPRGFRYLEVIVRGDVSSFVLHDIGLTRAGYPAERKGDFECSDPELNRIWEVGCETLRACMEDAYLDCPRRERGLYAGDSFVQFFINLAAYGDKDLMRRCIELFFLTQDEEGFLAPGAHGLAPGRHPDYSAIMAQALWHYYARTGDTEFLEEMEPGLRKLMEAIDSLQVRDTDLLGGGRMNPYIDRQRMDRRGVNCALNCFYQRAFFDAARVMEVLRKPEVAARYRARAEELAAAIRQEFWDGEREVFTDRRPRVRPYTGPSVAANALPLLYDIAGEDQAGGALEYLVEAMRQNLEEGRGRRGPNVMPYFSFYALGALYRHGRAEEAESFIRRCWGMLLRRGAWTWWEVWSGGSRCHAWSGSPTHYLSSRVLGVRFPEAGNPDVVSIEPQPGTLRWARGTYPHRRGLIRVDWKMEDGRLQVDWEAPPGVEVRTGETRATEERTDE